MWCTMCNSSKGQNSRGTGSSYGQMASWMYTRCAPLSVQQLVCLHQVVIPGVRRRALNRNKEVCTTWCLWRSVAASCGTGSSSCRTGKRSRWHPNNSAMQPQLLGWEGRCCACYMSESEGHTGTTFSNICKNTVPYQSTKKTSSHSFSPFPCLQSVKAEVMEVQKDQKVVAVWYTLPTSVQRVPLEVTQAITNFGL